MFHFTRFFKRRPHPTVSALEQAQSAFLVAIEGLANTNAETMRSIHQMVISQADASKAQSDAFNAFLQSFQVASAPVARTMRDEDEHRSELARKGFPVGGSPEAQLQWVLKNSDGDLDVDDLLRGSLI
jgi:hypothetical protein